MTKVFIDGSAGTTGLRIYERLESRPEIEIIKLKEEERKDTDARKKALNTADIAFLCLPDAAAEESASLVENNNTVVIDTSTAHRTQSGWAYGFPELGEDFEDNIKKSKRIVVPGCHASGFIALVRPLVKAGIISKYMLISCHSVTGYSGGGKSMIAEYECEERSPLLNAPRQYGISQQHKHLKEMTYITGLENPPVFCPIVADFYSGMVVTVPVFKKELTVGNKVGDIIDVYKKLYNSDIVRYTDSMDTGGFISANELSGSDAMQITVLGNDDRILLVARYDNLGKGASGAAVECMNIAMGMDKNTGLSL
jgi:N-acetyl-gamma-glutamyl-phosphate reductase